MTVAKFLRTGAWGKIVDRELEKKRKAVEKANNYAAELKAQEAYLKARRQASIVYLYDSVNKTFPVGLLRRVLSIMRENGISYKLEDRTKPPKPAFKLKYQPPAEYEDREYQDRAVEIAMHCRLGVFAMATNSGKTAVMMRIIEQRPVNTLVLVQKQELLYQIQESFSELSKYHAGIAGDSILRLRPITVGIVNTAHAKIDALEEHGFQQVFVDEGHHAASRIHFTVLRRLKPYACYSMTGTDFRTKREENVVLQAAFGGTYYRVDNQYMAEKGYSARLEAEILDCEQEFHPRWTWQRVYNDAILNSQVRNNMIVDSVAAHAEAGRTVLVLTDQTPHGHYIQQLLEARGVESRFMHGGKTNAARQKARKEFKERKFPVLIGTTIYDEGIDFPTLDVIALAGGKKAKGKVLQRLGRNQRRGYYEDGTRKDVGIVVDVCDTGHRLLKSHSLRRLKAMLDAGVVLPDKYSRLLEEEGFSNESNGGSNRKTSS
jgi:superfamily II DNA or RNA helicase